jgi:hypothetical protein
MGGDERSGLGDLSRTRFVRVATQVEAEGTRNDHQTSAQYLGSLLREREEDD